MTPDPSETPLAKRLGWMADAVVSAKVGPQARFFTRERIDEIVLLLREAEKHIVDSRGFRRSLQSGLSAIKSYKDGHLHTCNGGEDGPCDCGHIDVNDVIDALIADLPRAGEGI